MAEALIGEHVVKRSKAGRKRKPGPRERNGRVQRGWNEETATAARSVVVADRVRRFDLSHEDAAKQEAGTIVGRLYLKGRLGDLKSDEGKQVAYERLRAADLYREVRHAYLNALDAPGRPVQPPPEECGVDGPEVAYAASRRRYNGLMRDLRDGAGNGLMIQALENVVGRDIEMPFLERWLIDGLDAVHKHFSGGRG